MRLHVRMGSYLNTAVTKQAEDIFEPRSGGCSGRLPDPLGVSAGPLDGGGGAAIAQTRDWLTWLDGALREAVAGGLYMGEAANLPIPPRFAGMAAPFGVVARELSSRGLFYVDARPDAPPTPDLAGCSVNLVLDQSPARASIEAQLATLERLAHDRGGAVGLVGPPLPVVVETIAAWARGLEARGVVLAPASALSHPAEPIR